ncbi:N-acetylglucosamine-1-phosphodiester alpha-N-acetylglucosaminidase [Mytilus galloprovincialis]|uniref:N-acetylglucosamine-1-phosphodiester alpha-N-acetylglucosaminidase n=1 Tax=Mytilus galloprovincialis TaxID=29158 RepID=A0A8B6EVH2_MYTGA|nr:N-acetylglucosamine-1-phosphodiester alpha-N-acetylglucosaminidase [Mytilus galloprovincialis]
MIEFESLQNHNNINQTDLTRGLITIDGELESDDIKSLKFLCQDHIAQKTLEKIKDGIQIFNELERLGKIDTSRGEVDYLLECLCRCHRIDLIKKMGFNQIQVKNRVESGRSNFSPFRLLLFEIAEEMETVDLKTALFTLSSNFCIELKKFIEIRISQAFSRDFLQGTRQDTYGHFTIVNNPDRTISVLEPRDHDGCQNQIKSTVMETSKQKSCIVAVNAGFFEPRPGNVCLGNIISDGRVVMKSEGVQNVHFGITNDGSLHFGYLSKTEIADNNYKQLIGGVFWLVRDGQNYLKESINIECQTEEQAEIMEMYSKTILSARSAIGHDEEGRILLMQLDGFNGHKGMTLYEFADVLLDYGFVQAINLDGGGSTTLTINGTLVNHPTDKW